MAVLLYLKCNKLTKTNILLTKIKSSNHTQSLLINQEIRLKCVPFLSIQWLILSKIPRLYGFYATAIVWVGSGGIFGKIFTEALPTQIRKS